MARKPLVSATFSYANSYPRPLLTRKVLLMIHSNTNIHLPCCLNLLTRIDPGCACDVPG
jgi:hypothetical protein